MQAPDPLAPGVARAPTVLLREILSQTERFEHGMARDLGINDTDLAAMIHLIQSGPLRPGELAMRLEMSPAAVTTVIDRLEDAGHVSRSPDPGDRRSVMVAPMQASVHRAMVRIGPMVGDVDAVLDDFPPEEQAAIQRYLGLVVERYENHLAPTD